MGCERSGERPSMVVIVLPATEEMGVTQARIGAPLLCTVHAPHSDMPHPNLVPVKPRGDEQGKIHDAIAAEIAGFPREGILDAFDQAAGRSRSRRRAVLFFLYPFADQPEVVDRLRAWLSDPDPESRRIVVQIIGGR